MTSSIFSTASQTYWDPETLFQITGISDSAQVQCMGRAKTQKDARCRWEIRGKDRAEIFKLLDRLAQTTPGDINDSDLWALARLCLCKDWHADQASEVVHRWRGVVRRAAQNYSNASNASSRESTPEMEIQSFVLSERQRCLVELGEQQDSTAALDELIRGKMSKYIEKISQLSRYLDVTKVSLASVQKDNEAIRSNHKVEVEKIKKDAEVEKEAMKKNFETSQTELWKQYEQIYKLERQIHQAATEKKNSADRHAAELLQMNQSLEESRNTERKLRQSSSNLETELLKMKEAEERRTADNQGIEEEKSGLQSEIARKEQQLKNAQSQLEVSRKGNERLDADNIHLKREIDSIRGTLSQLENNSTQLSAELARKSRTLEESQAATASVAKEKAYFENKVRELYGRIAELEAVGQATTSASATQDEGKKKKSRRHFGCFGF